MALIKSNVKVPSRYSMQRFISSYYSVEQSEPYIEYINKSKFVVKIGNIITVEDAFVFLKNNEDRKASHNCWAFRISSTSRSSDDGEPGGTAGRPILNAIESADIINTAILVTRYFGGIKLGTGGLIRAYGSVSQTALQDANKKLLVEKAIVKLSMQIEYISPVYQLLLFYQANHLKNNLFYQKISEEYVDQELELVVVNHDINLHNKNNNLANTNEKLRLTTSSKVDLNKAESGYVCITIKISETELKMLEQKFSDACKGKGLFEIVEKFID
jgi:uncharacterized YigZ family protein